MEGQGIVVAVGAVIRDEDGRVLLVKHVPERGGFWQGKWICPGGKLALGKTVREGVLREVKEETGLDIRLVGPVTPFERVVRDTGGVKLHVVYIDYLARKVGGTLLPASDVGEAFWADTRALRARWSELHEDTQQLLTLARVI